VKLYLPLVELWRQGGQWHRAARAVRPFGEISFAGTGCQRGTSSVTLAKGHTAPAVLRLVTIPISHYCEKARWALERAGIGYREEPHVQGVHRLAARHAGGGTTVPVLVTPQGAIGESAEILLWVDERTRAEHRLFPRERGERLEAARLCGRLDGELGPRGRRLMYVHMLAQRELALSFNNRGVPAWEDRMMRLGWPLVGRMIGSVLGIRPGIEIEDEAALWREFDFVAELLADGRPYLSGERFGAADLTFAALSAAVVVPPEYGTPLPQPDAMPPPTAAIVRRARAHPAGRHALALFADHRRELVA
jgi:glutathione S-transferase